MTIPVLVVDADDEYRSLTAKTLDGTGQYRAFPAESAKSALRLLSESRAQIAIVDIDLPDVKGVELIQQLEQKYERYRKKGAYLNERRKRIVNVVKEAQPVKIRDIHRVLNDISKNTLKKDLKYLVEQNVLEKIGKNARGHPLLSSP